MSSAAAFMQDVWGTPIPREDDNDFLLQEAIRASLEEAEQQRIKMEEAEAVMAAEARRSAPLPPPPGIVETFLPEQWLSDASLSFAYAQLVQGGEPSKLPESVLLMDPAAAFWLTAQDDPQHVEEAKGALKLQERELVLCPVNDSRDVAHADMGTHWTLLVCWDRQPIATGATEGKKQPPCCSFGRFSYYDSLGCASGGRNLTQAKMLASRLAGRSAQVSVGACARQTNSFDCGVYVLLFSEIVASTFIENNLEEEDV